MDAGTAGRYEGLSEAAPTRRRASLLIHALSLVNSRAQSLAHPMAHMFVFYSGRDQRRPKNLSFWHIIGLCKTVYKSISKVLDTEISLSWCAIVAYEIFT